MIPRTAELASSPPATARTCGMTRSAGKKPTTLITAVTLGRAAGERRRRDAAAVAPNVALELLLALERGDVLAALLDQPLDERAHLDERRIRLLRCEVAHGCNPMRPWTWRQSRSMRSARS